jgi:hypothetical protein
VAFLRALDWTQLRAAIELGVALSTVERWVTPPKGQEANCRIPGWAYEHMRRLAGDAGFDSLGKLRVG